MSLAAVVFWPPFSPATTILPSDCKATAVTGRGAAKVVNDDSFVCEAGIQMPGLSRK